MNLINQYLPGAEWLLALLFVHMLIATIYHIKNKDFKFTCWPNYMINAITFVIFIILANGVLEISKSGLNNSILITILTGLQAAAYIQYITYYLANILNHLKDLGVPINDTLISTITGIPNRIKQMMGIN